MAKTRLRALCKSTLTAAVLLLASPAAPQSAAERTAAAKDIFDKAVQLAAEKKFDEACPKFAEVIKLQPEAIGAMLELAKCYEGQGQTASALGAYVEAEAASTRAGQVERTEAARQKIAELRATVAKLVIVVAERARRISGLTVQRDGTTVGETVFGVPVPVNPGAHTISAAAPGKQPWTSQVDVRAGAGIVTVHVPELADMAAEPATEPPGPGLPAPRSPPDTGPTEQPAAVAERRGWTGQRIAGVTIGSIGVAGGAIAAGLWIATSVKASEGEEKDAAGDLKGGNDLRDSARSLQTAAIISTIAGGVCVIGGVALFLTAPASASRDRASRVVLRAGVTPRGAVLAGSF